MRAAYLLPLLLAAACAHAVSTEPPPEHVDVPAVAPLDTTLPEPPTPPIDLKVTPEDDTPAPLTGAWSTTFNHTAKYADASQNLKVARIAYVNAAAAIFAPDAGMPSATDFDRANAALDLLSRRYAAVYYAPDATDSQRIETLEEASSTLLRWSERLTEIGLDKMPASFRTNSSLAVTFEDVVHGPAKRWRGEGLTLAHTCVARAAQMPAKTYAATECAELVKSHAHLPTPPHAVTQPECACVPGDPLCSASLSGWCKPKS